MKTISLFIIAAAIVAVGAGGFVQIRSLNARVLQLEALASKAQAAPREQAPNTNPPPPADSVQAAANQPALEDKPPAPQVPASRPSPSASPRNGVSYLDQLLDQTP